MAFTTTYKNSVPYNTIRLSKDVAQWAQTEQTYINNTGLPPVPNVVNVRMSTLQTTAGAQISPDDGNLQSGSLGDMRWGIAVTDDIRPISGVYDSQQAGNNPYVETRYYNLSSNPEQIRLSRLADWDYTAAVYMDDISKWDFGSGISSDWRCTSYGTELYKDMPAWAFAYRNMSSTSTRKVVVIRSNPNGGRYSSYAQTNRSIGNHPSDMNDGQALAPLTGSFQEFDTDIRSFILFGRKTSSTSYVRAATYNVLIDPSTNTFNTTLSSSADLTTNLGGPVIAHQAAYLRKDLVAVYAGRSGGRSDLLRVDTSNGISSVVQALDTGNSYSYGGGVVTIPDETGTLPVAFPIWMETQSTYNRYVKIKGYNLNTTTFANYSSNTLTVFDNVNTFKGCGGALLHAGDGGYTDPHYILVWASDTTGNIRLQVVRHGVGTLSSTGSAGPFASTTVTYGDTDVTAFPLISPLSAVYKTDVDFSGETFTPGGTNDFKRRRYFALSAATNQSQDPNELYYGYYDIDNNVLNVWNAGGFNGREMRLASNNFDTEGRQYARDLYLRGEAGAVWMPFLGGRYIGSADRRLTFGMASLDFKPYWGGLNAADPGGTFYDQGGEIGTTGEFITTTEEANWDLSGRWYVLGPHPAYPGNVSNLCAFRSSYLSNVTFSDGVGANLDYFWCYDRDIDGVNWNSFITNEVTDYNKLNTVYIQIETNNLSASFELSPSTNPSNISTGTINSNPYFLIDFPGSNGHGGDSWGWLWHTGSIENNGENAVGITFSQSPF